MSRIVLLLAVVLESKSCIITSFDERWQDILSWGPHGKESTTESVSSLALAQLLLATGALHGEKLLARSSGTNMEARGRSKAYNFQQHSRRSMLGGATVASVGYILTPEQASAKTVDYKAASAAIAKLVKADPDKGPTLVRLAWHSSGTYDRMAKNGGSGGGTIRFKEELAHGANAGLNKAVKWLEPLHSRFRGISYADLYTLAGVSAIAAMSGPKIGWGFGRVDAMDPSAVTPDGRLPAADKGAPKATAKGLRDVFYRMGFNDQEIVALSGAHALGRCHPDASGYDGPWTSAPTTFSNAYYSYLKNIKWTKREWNGPLQYEDPSKKLMMLPSDLVLLSDKAFAKYVDKYAKDYKAFNTDFAMAFQKLEELGTSGLTPVAL